jgi:transposase
MGGAFSRRYSHFYRELPGWSRDLPFTELTEPGFGAVGYGEVRPRLCKNVKLAIITPSQRREVVMKRFIEGEDRNQSTLFPECLDDYIAEDNPVRFIDVFVDKLDLGQLGFGRIDPKVTGRPAYHPSMLLKLYIYAYLNCVQSSRRIELEAQRNVELMWLTERLSPDHKTISDFRKDNKRGVRGVCREFVVLCRHLNLFTQAMVIIDGSKFKAVNNRDRNFTRAKMKRRLAQVEASLDRYFEQLEQADREESSIADSKTGSLKDKIATLKQEIARLNALEVQMQAAPDSRSH